ncbi:MAG: prepilin peptidase, partial [bacterium]|nr:prepilin peptidase [bacterium]
FPSPLSGRSLCPSCRHKLAWYDLIPLLSFILLRAKCRYCHGRISLQYPLVELLTGLTAVSAYLWADNPLLSFFIFAVFIVLFTSDFLYGTLPDEITLPAILVLLISHFFPRSGIPFDGTSLIFNYLLSGLIPAGIFFLINYLSKGRAMGEGDIRLVALMGFFLGFPKILIAMWAGFILGGVVSFALVLLKKKAFSSTIALGPFLIIGILISLIIPWRV